MAYAHRLRLRDNITTRHIISGKYNSRSIPEQDLAEHLFEDVHPGFSKEVEEGDFIVAGSNFGCGSSREIAPLAIKASGVKAVVAKSFSRIFYRNAFNVGLCLIECETNYIDDMDEIELDLDKNRIRNNTKCVDIDIKPLPQVMRKFLEKGGVIACFKDGGLDSLL